MNSNIKIDPERDEIVSSSVMKQIKIDLAGYKKLLAEYKTLKIEFEKIDNEHQLILKEIEAYKLNINSLYRKYKKLEEDNIKSKIEIEKAEKRIENYQSIAKRKTIEANKYKKLKGIAAIKFAELVIIESIFVGIIIGVLAITK